MTDTVCRECGSPLPTPNAPWCPCCCTNLQGDPTPDLTVGGDVQ